MIKNLGEIAAIGTAFCWSIGPVFFTIAARRIGANTVNRLRLVLTFFLLALTHLFLFGKLLPINASVSVWFWFGISGIVGFTIGDTFLFNAFVLIGPRLSMLMMSSAPIFGLIIGWLFLNEVLSRQKIIAILITLVGIGWVILEQKNKKAITESSLTKEKEKSYLKGVLIGLGAAFCQALGLSLSKKGLANDFPALSGNLIRIAVASIFIWLIPIFQHKVLDSIRKLKDSKARLGILGGALFGPYLGVWLSLVAVQKTYIGIASTLMALPPVILLPFSHWLLKERISLRAIFGTVIAIIGVGLIFLF